MSNDSFPVRRDDESPVPASATPGYQNKRRQSTTPYRWQSRYRLRLHLSNWTTQKGLGRTILRRGGEARRKEQDLPIQSTNVRTTAGALPAGERGRRLAPTNSAAQ